MGAFDMEEVFFCLVVPFLLFVGIVVGLIWLIIRLTRPKSAQPAGQMPVEHITPALLSQPGPLNTAMEQLIIGWAEQGRLAQEHAQAVLDVLRAERAAQKAPQTVAPQAAPVGPQTVAPQAAPQAMPATPAEPTAVAQPSAPMTTLPSEAIAPQTVQPVIAPQAVAAAAAPTATAAPPQPAKPSALERVFGGLLALRTRQMLLFLGAFLLVISALILVVFNWASFPPILQFALLASVCGSLWVGGHFLSSRWGLEGAGMGLRTIGAVLTPVVAFALSRPGLLDLPFAQGWLLSSLISLAVYLFAFWKLRHIAYLFTSCAAVVSSVGAAVYSIAPEWMPFALVLTCCGMLLAEQWITPRAASFGAAPRWVAVIGVPLIFLLAFFWRNLDLISTQMFTLVLWAMVVFYGLGTYFKRTNIWMSLTVAFLIFAQVAVAITYELESGERSLLYIGTALVLLAGATLFDQRLRRLSIPVLGATILFTLFSVHLNLTPNFAAIVFLLQVAWGALLAWAVLKHFAFLSPQGQLLAGVFGLGFAGALFPVWAVKTVEWLANSQQYQHWALIGAAAVLFLVAYFVLKPFHTIYDIVLQGLGTATTVIATILFFGKLPAFSLVLSFADYLAFSKETTILISLALTSVWLLQVFLRRHWFWVVLATPMAVLTGHFTLQSLDVDKMGMQLYFLAVCALLSIGGTLLRRTPWRFAITPMILWSIIVGLFLISGVLIDGLVNSIQAHHVLILLGLAATQALLSAMWRQPWIGYPTVLIASLAALLAADRDFFGLIELSPTQIGYVFCALALLWMLVGQVLRRVTAKAYAYPYELLGLVLSLLAPLTADRSDQDATLTWLAVGALFGLAIVLYRLPWLLGIVLAGFTMALLRGADWLYPNVFHESILLLAATWLHATIGMAARLRERQETTPLRWEQRYSFPAYGVALLSGATGLLAALDQSYTVAFVGIGLAALLAAIATVERVQMIAWSSLLFLVIGLLGLHDWQDLSRMWSNTALNAEMLLLCALGWALSIYVQQANATNTSASASLAQVWLKPLWIGPLVISFLALLQQGMLGGFLSLLPLIVSCVLFALHLTTLAVQYRQPIYAYGASLALMLALLLQLADLGFRDMQWFVIPSAIYLLGMAECLRRLHGQRGLAQLLEVGAVLLALGTTLGQSLTRDGLESQMYALALCLEALVFLGYGIVRQLRMPFLGGGAFFVLGVLWLSVNPLMAMNKWLLMGLLGLLLVGVYVLLERRQEQLARAGRIWLARINSWS